MAPVSPTGDRRNRGVSYDQLVADSFGRSTRGTINLTPDLAARWVESKWHALFQQQGGEPVYRLGQRTHREVASRVRLCRGWNELGRDLVLTRDLLGPQRMMRCIEGEECRLQSLLRHLKFGIVD